MSQIKFKIGDEVIATDDVAGTDITTPSAHAPGKIYKGQVGKILSGPFTKSGMYTIEVDGRRYNIEIKNIRHHTKLEKALK